MGTDPDGTRRTHALITALRNDGYDVAYGADENEDFDDHVATAREVLEEPDELMGYYLVAMSEGQTDYYSSTVVSGSRATGVAQIQMLGAHFRSVLEATGLETSDLVDVMIDEAVTVDEVDDGQ